MVLYSMFFLFSLKKSMIRFEIPVQSFVVNRTWNVGGIGPNLVNDLIIIIDWNESYIM